jgi:lactate permease
MIMAGIPVVMLLLLIASGKVEAYVAAFIALVAGLLIAIFVFTRTGDGAVTGLFPIGSITRSLKRSLTRRR